MFGNAFTIHLAARVHAPQLTFATERKETGWPPQSMHLLVLAFAVARLGQPNFWPAWKAKCQPRNEEKAIAPAVFTSRHQLELVVAGVDLLGQGHGSFENRGAPCGEPDAVLAERHPTCVCRSSLVTLGVLLRAYVLAPLSTDPSLGPQQIRCRLDLTNEAPARPSMPCNEKSIRCCRNYLSQVPRAPSCSMLLGRTVLQATTTEALNVARVDKANAWRTYDLRAPLPQVVCNIFGLGGSWAFCSWLQHSRRGVWGHAGGTSWPCRDTAGCGTPATGQVAVHSFSNALYEGRETKVEQRKICVLSSQSGQLQISGQRIS